MSAGTIEDIERMNLITRTDRPIDPGNTVIRLRAVPEGIVGEEIVIDPAGANPETRTVLAQDNRDITVAPMTFTHGPDRPVVRTGIAQYITSGAQMSLAADTAGGAVQITVKSKLDHIQSGQGYVVIDPGTAECEIRPVGFVLGNAIAVANLAYAHNTNDPVLFTYEPKVNLLWFGADRTGVADSAAAIQAWADSDLSFSGGYLRNVHLYAPSGNYLSTASIDFTDRRNVEISGDGLGATIFTFAVAGKPGFDFTGSGWNKMHDLTIVGDSTDIPSTGTLLARSTAINGENSGFNKFERVDWRGHYSITCFYNWCSELNVWDHCLMVNQALACKGTFFTGGRNRYAITSDYAVFSATVSNSTGDLRDCTIQLFGAAAPPDGVIIQGDNSGGWRYTGYVASSLSCPSWLIEGTQYGVFCEATLEHNQATYNWHIIPYSAPDVMTGLQIKNMAAIYTTKAIKVDAGVTLLHPEIDNCRFINVSGADSEMEFQDVQYANIGRWWDATAGDITAGNVDFSHIEYYAHTMTLTDRWNNEFICHNVGVSNQALELTGRQLRIGPRQGASTAKISAVLTYSSAWQPGGGGGVADGDSVTLLIADASIATADQVLVSFDQFIPNNVHLTATCNGGAIYVMIFNNSGGAYNPAAGTVRAMVIKS